MRDREAKATSVAKSILAMSAVVPIWLWSATAMGQSESLAASETTVTGGTLVIITYLILWAMVGGVLFFVIRRQRRLQAELDGLENRIDEMLGTATDGD